MSLGAQKATAQGKQRSEVKCECYWFAVYYIELTLALAMNPYVIKRKRADEASDNQ